MFSLPMVILGAAAGAIFAFFRFGGLRATGRLLVSLARHGHVIVLAMIPLMIASLLLIGS